jgi:hypothetical protein
MSKAFDRQTLEAALIGYQQQASVIEQKMAELRKELRGSPAGTAPTVAQKPHRKKMSAAGRKRIAAAQRKRWAEYNEAKSERSVASKLPKKKSAKRRLSAAGRANIVAALKKRWAAKKAAVAQ